MTRSYFSRKVQENRHSGILFFYIFVSQEKFSKYIVMKEV